MYLLRYFQISSAMISYSSSFIPVHGFQHSLYYLREGENLTISFLREVKGTTRFPFLQLDGLITSEADTAGKLTVFLHVCITETAAIATLL